MLVFFFLFLDKKFNLSVSKYFNKIHKDTKKEGRKEEGQQNYPETQEREPTRFRDCHVQQGNSSKFACIYHLY